MRRCRNYGYLRESEESGWKLILNGNENDVREVVSDGIYEDDYADWDEYNEAVTEKANDIIDNVYEKISGEVDAQLRTNGGIYVRCRMDAEGDYDWYEADCIIEGGECGYVDSFNELLEKADIDVWMCVYQNNQGYLVFEDNYANQRGKEDAAMLVILTEEGKRARKEGKSAEEVFNTPECYKPSNLHMKIFNYDYCEANPTESRYTKHTHRLNEGLSQTDKLLFNKFYDDIAKGLDSTSKLSNLIKKADKNGDFDPRSGAHEAIGELNYLCDQIINAMSYVDELAEKEDIIKFDD